MQGGNRSRRLFERARNEVDLGVLGDPERWGGVGECSFTIPDQTSAYTPQIIRAQCSDLIARGWDLFCAWQIDGLGLTDNIDYQGLEITIGSGQAAWTQILDLRGNALGVQPLVGPPTSIAPAVFWQFTPGNGGLATGAISLRVPIPAAAINARGLIAVSAPPDHIPPHKISARIFVAIAPRALI